MTFPAFLDAGYVLLHEEFQRLGEDILSVNERLSSWGTATEEQAEPVKSERTAAQNDQSMALLKAQMAGLGG